LKQIFLFFFSFYFQHFTVFICVLK
jgi:hypothetical protein